MALAISSTYTPWSAASISHNSQYKRFESSGLSGTFEQRQANDRQSYQSDSDDIYFGIYMNKDTITQSLPIE